MAWLAALGAATAAWGAEPFVKLAPAESGAGYLARLLINEAPFPGERGYVSELDSKDTMVSILWVLHSRMHHVPAGYKREELASTKSLDVFDLITAKRQCDGFYRARDGSLAMDRRVVERVAYLEEIANGGGKPGRFAALLDYAQKLATAYLANGAQGTDIFKDLSMVGAVPVTGRAYAWMTGQDVYHPGGNFVRIPEVDRGVLGGNRFFTLRKDPQ